MSLASYIEKVRAKPEAEKQPIVFGWTVALTTLIFLIWALSFSLSVANNQNRNQELQRQAETAAAVSDQPSGLATVVGNLSSLVNETVDSITNGFWIAIGLIHR
ncbi:MAG: hypothetical protein COV08_03250 [Candidatus Vogelbacteria bacterium CG10_big_fil_rev_8_21_14_0_10_49_38]|uniref:Uncharacterized protein n=1 Tax=Candidatus Vogelbacteria bacterium CG10_big_fil_rev_8_21_14_0_10_49_38 TaxID=1975043 RepID=A0A2H0RGS4_9BACT|nr:MAG: hypothetical protein BK006_03250 [bacterium CG10_49_38]PIR45761.1 MAG: hypothetical protein COV08_03250 [Candidatus Vogelbacteria bacterium CG10_big_fil_rev_8_21_14_0_10_49_38]